MPLLTVFTPTYNRAYTLPKLYESLCQQSCKDFMWLIVDDGSSDNTANLVAAWKSECRIEIEYHRQPNGGKMRAHNFGVRHCRTPLFICIDSDDYITDNCVETITHKWPLIAADSHLAGSIAYKSIAQKGGSSVRCRFPKSSLEQTHSTLESLYREGFVGDTTLVFKTEVIRQHPFLEVEGEKFSTEAYAYNQIDQKYSYLLVDEAWTMCEYIDDGYTQNWRSLYSKYPKGWALYFNQKVKFIPGYLNKEKVAFAVLYMIFARRGGFKNIYQQSEVKGICFPFLWLLSYFYEWKWKEKYPK